MRLGEGLLQGYTHPLKGFSTAWFFLRRIDELRPF
jgi:hypothetical protein